MAVAGHVTRAELEHLRRYGRVTTETGLCLEVVE